MTRYIGNTPDITINGISPDASGNFTLGLDEFDVAARVHGHKIADIVGLQDSLDSKSDLSHTHNYVTGLNVNGNISQGQVSIETQGDMAITAAGNVVTLVAQASAISVTDSITDSSDGSTQIKTFVGTRAEWDAFTKDPAIKYIVYIHV